MGLFDIFKRAPKPEPVAVPEKPTEQAGVGGTAVFGDGWIYSKEKSADLRDAARWKTFNEYAHNIAIVATAIRRYSDLFGLVEWRFVPAKVDGAATPETEQLAEFARQQLMGMDTPWSTVVERAGLFKWFGVSAQEWTAKVIAEGEWRGKFGLRDIAIRPADTIERWPMVDGRLTEIVQRDPGDGSEHRIPREKLFYLVDGLLTDSPFGTGLLRHVAEPARRLGVLEAIEGWGFQTDLGGQAVGRVPAGEMASLPAQKQTELTRGLREFLENPIKRPGLGLILDSGTYKDAAGQPSSIPKWGVELLRAAGTSHKEVGDAIKRLIWQNALVLGVEHLMVGFDGAGSNSHQQQKSSDFYRLVISTLNKVADACKRDVLTPLWTLNGWDTATVPTPTIDKLAFQDITAVIDGLAKLTTENPRFPHVQQIYEAWGLTPPPEDMLEEAAEERRTEAEAQFGLKRQAADDEAVDVDLEQDDEEDD